MVSRFLAYLILLCWMPISFASTFQLVEVSELPIYAIESTEPRANLVAIIGGKGLRNGEGRSKNFLVREAETFNELGFNVYLFPNSSKDENASYSLRVSSERIDRVIALVNGVVSRNKAPIYIIGFSRGTIEAMLAAFSGHKDLAGVILLSGIYNKGKYSLPKLASNQKVSVPILVVHHRLDSCSVSPFLGAREFVDSLDWAQVALHVFDGGGSSGRECGPFHYHGFEGIEDSISETIRDWILETKP